MFYLSLGFSCQLSVSSPGGPITLSSTLAFLRKGPRRFPSNPGWPSRAGERQQTNRNPFHFSTLFFPLLVWWIGRVRELRGDVCRVNVKALHQKQKKKNKTKQKSTSMQDECVQYVGPYGAIPLASAALHVEVCHEQTVCNKCLEREQGFCLLWKNGARHSPGLIQVL